MLLSLLLAEGVLRFYLWSKGIGHADVRDLLRRSQSASVTEFRGRGIHGLIRPSEHQDLVYELKPSLQGTHHGQPFRTNAHGFRGREIEVRKPPNTFRVVGLGDSHMFGWGVGQGKTFLEVLERRLNEAVIGGRTFEVLNFAAPGYNTVMEVAMLGHRARHFEPDLVVIHFVGNDFDPPHFAQPPRSVSPSQWYLWELFRGLIERDEELERIEPDTSSSRRRRSLRSREPYRHLAGTAKYREAMNRLRLLTREQSIPVLVLMLGAGPGRALVREVAEQNGFRLVDARRHFVAKMEKDGIEVSRRNWKRLFRLRDGHPTPVAHAAYADALFNEMEEMRFVRGAAEIGGLR